MKRLVWSALASLSLAIPMLAYATDAYVAGNVNLRAGPDISYPLVDQLPAGTEIDVQGCTEGWEWCDVINDGDGNRGWIAGNFIQYEYQDQPVLLPDYGAEIGIPIVAFAIGSYWDNYYRGRPFYANRASWYNRPMPHRPPPAPPGRPYRGPSRPGPAGGVRPLPAPGYQRPGHLGPVTPGRPMSTVPGNRPPQRGNAVAKPPQKKDDQQNDNGGH